MLQKVFLIGLLTFVDQGSILQCIVGLSCANAVLVCMVKQQPYCSFSSNVLACLGQGVLALSFLSALLLRVDLTGEQFTADMIGTAIIAANVPMAL